MFVLVSKPLQGEPFPDLHQDSYRQDYHAQGINNGQHRRHQRDDQQKGGLKPEIIMWFEGAGFVFRISKLRRFAARATGWYIMAQI